MYVYFIYPLIFDNHITTVYIHKRIFSEVMKRHSLELSTPVLGHLVYLYSCQRAAIAFILYITTACISEHRLQGPCV